MATRCGEHGWPPEDVVAGPAGRLPCPHPGCTPAGVVRVEVVGRMRMGRSPEPVGYVEAQVYRRVWAGVGVKGLRRVVPLYFWKRVE